MKMTIARITTAALLVAIAAGCSENPAESVAGLRASPEARRTFTDVPPGEMKFVAWANEYLDGPIRTQTWGTLDARQYRQNSGFTFTPAIAAFATAHPGKLYIVGDEPDQWCSDPQLAATSPYDYAGIFHDFVTSMRAVDPDARFSAAFAEPNGECGKSIPNYNMEYHSTGYAQMFYDAYIARYGVVPPINEWRFHDFAGTITSENVDEWYQRVSAAAQWSVNHGAYMVLGSWGFLGWTQSGDAFDEKMRYAMELIRNDSRIRQAVWCELDTGCGGSRIGSLRDANGNLTHQGQIYASTGMTITMEGPTSSDPGMTETWYARVGDTMLGVSYAWYVNGVWAGSGTSLTRTTGWEPFEVLVRVTDAHGVQRHTSQYVEVRTDRDFPWY